MIIAERQPDAFQDGAPRGAPVAATGGNLRQIAGPEERTAGRFPIDIDNER